MKTILTTIFAIALMVFAFNTNPAEAAGAWGVFGSNESVDELKDPDETQVARGYVPDCRWKWHLDSNTGNWGWVCQYYNESEPLADNVASWDDDEKADQYGDDWFNSENDDRELASTRPLTRQEKQAQDENDWNQWILRQFSGLQPGQRKALDGEGAYKSWIQQQFASYWSACQRSGNCMMNEDEVDVPEYASLMDFLDRDRKDWNEAIKSGFASNGCKVRFDGASFCPGDAWNSDYPDSESSDGFGGRDIADSGNEGSTSAASAGDR